MRPLTLLALLLLLPLLAGCFGATAVPLPLDRLVSLRDELVTLDRLSATDLEERMRTLTDQVKAAGSPKDRAARSEIAHQQLLLGYCWERQDHLKDATADYYSALGSDYASVASFRIAQIAQHELAAYQQQASDTSLSDDEREVAKGLLEATRKQAMQYLERAANYPPDTKVLLRSPEVGSLQPGTWEIKGVRREAYARLDVYYRTTLSYRVFQQLVRFCGGEKHRKASYVLALVVLAVLAKLITTPLSLTQFKSMRAMQAVQPELKKLQEKYKDDKAALAREQMALFKAHGVNPVSGCLPMLIQLPILMWVYWGIRHFTYRFMGVPFLYLPSLGDPDIIPGTAWPGPLLLLYGLSMYVSQKLISPPTTTPEQRQQQKLLAYMMPVMFVILFRSLPVAFILYWLLMNVLVTGHQYLIMRPQRLAQVAAAAAPPPPPPPPPEAIRKLSQGTTPSAKKRKRRRRV